LAGFVLPAAAEPRPVPLQFMGLYDTHAGLAAALKNKYGETPIAMGTVGGDYVMEVFANPETGTWTVVLTQANGTACGITSGDNYEEQAPADLTGNRI